MKKLLFTLFVVLLIVGCGRSEIATKWDKEAILQIDELAIWIENFSPDSSKESLKKTKDFDNSYNIEYEYDDSLNENAPYLYYDISAQPTKSDAVIYGSGLKIGASIGYGYGDAKEIPRNDLFGWGDESKFCLLQTEDGTTFGNSFFARKGKLTVFFIISGVYFDRSEDIHDLLDEKLKALERLPTP